MIGFLKIAICCFKKLKYHGKSNSFSIKSGFGQLISLLNDSLIRKEVKKCDSDCYTKRLAAKDHLISMLFCSFSKCTPLRKIAGVILGLSEKTSSFQLNRVPKKCTLSAANKKRDVLVLENIYYQLLKQHGGFLLDSSIRDVKKKINQNVGNYLNEKINQAVLIFTGH